MTRIQLAILATSVLVFGGACEDKRPDDQAQESRPLRVPVAVLSALPSAPASSRAGAQGVNRRAEPKPEKRPVELFAGGDVSFGRMRGERLLRSPQRDDFAPIGAWLRQADLRFINLESPLSNYPLQGRTKMVFSGPPVAAQALRRAGIDIVSLANNHSWDYGKDGLMQTIGHLERVGIRYVGAHRQEGQALKPVVIEKHGMKLAFLAVTAIWNQSFSPHPGKSYVADAEAESLLTAIKSIKGEVDFVILSHHGGYEYVAEPHPGTIRLLRAAMNAGVDVVLGHHPHVVQRVALVGDKPLFYSLGNLLMRMANKQPWTEFGIIAQITLDPGGTVSSRICPYRIFGLEALPLVQDPKRELYQRHFALKFNQLLRAGALLEPDARTELGGFDRNGCAPLTASRR